MKNRYMEKLSSIVKVTVEGKNINNYISRIIKKKIEIIKLTPISYKEAHLIMKYSEYQKLKNIKTIIYKVTLLSYMGRLKIEKNIHKNSILLLFLVLGIILIGFLSKFIFSIEVIHQDKQVRELILNELKKYNIKKYQLKKTYQELEKIENKILENNKNKLEWIEITETGTKYTVRVEERKINNKKEEKQYQNIISKKEAILVSVKAKSGEKLKTTNDYVKKGDVIIAGYITLPNNTKIPTVAEGEVLGEVWYNIKIDYPFVYQESKLTGKSKTVIAVYFLNKRIGLFNFNQFRTFSLKNKILCKSLLLNIRLVKEKQYETIVKDEVYTEDIAKTKAIDYIKNKLKKNNPNIKEIKEVKILTSSSDEDSMKLNLFVKAIENIGEEALLDKNILEKESN